MTGTGSRPRDFGDYLGEYLANGCAIPITSARGSVPTRRDDFDAELILRAEIFDLDASRVWKEFHGTSELAKLNRRERGVDVPKESAYLQTFLIDQMARKEGLKGETREAAVAERVSAITNVLGEKTRSLSGQSVAREINHGRAEYEATLSPIAAMFLIIGAVRNRTKLETPTKRKGDKE